MTPPPPPAFWFLNGRASIALAKADNVDGLSIIRQEMACGDAPPDHVHHGEDEVFHVLAGELTLRIAGAPVVARAGGTVLAPRDVPHGFTVTSPQGATFLTVTCGGFEDLVRAVGRPAETDGLPPAAAPSAAMRAALAAACAAHGITLFAPGHAGPGVLQPGSELTPAAEAGGTSM